MSTQLLLSLAFTLNSCGLPLIYEVDIFDACVFVYSTVLTSIGVYYRLSQCTRPYLSSYPPSIVTHFVGKVLRGSDGRDYLLEMMRLTPRDANYVHGEKGTAKVATLEGKHCFLLCFCLSVQLVVQTVVMLGA